ncbi:MAG: cyclic nucleotide-binding domain-containing protein [Deltaproteobacteria bacterium]|nr:cyclic nucleotide-binding domain-containing protein [Deltaproteobacteria bacterium]
MSRELEELQRRLADEPGNLGVRVALAGALFDAGRTNDAVELYRSVAIAYREQGRTQQAIAVCHSILEIAPADPISRGLLASFGETDRRSSGTFDQTPLPVAVPYHVADPTTRLIRKSSEPNLARPALARANDHDDDLISELETRKRQRFEEAEVLSRPPPTSPVQLLDLEDVATPYVREDVSRDTDRDMPDITNPNLPVMSTSQRIQSGALFASIPPEHRVGVYTRFRSQQVPAGTTVIRQGATDHPLVVVGRGELAVRIQRGSEVVALFDVVEGDHVGEGSLLARQPSPVHVVAVTECELLILPPHGFYEIAGAFPALWSRLKDIAERRAREQKRLLG